jgi:Tol biopolymer transport system component
MGPTYNHATELTWSPDGRRFAYLGSSPNGFFQVIDGEEIPAVHDVPEFQWSPDGKRYAFQGKGGGSATAYSMVVDGKPQPTPKGAVIRESFRWSPDSQHFTYGALVTAADYGPYLDGQAKPVYLGEFLAMTYAQPPITFPRLIFSPDGSRLAYVGRTYDATGRANSRDAVYVDGVRYEGPGQSYQFPSFSPDGKHFATVIPTGQGSVVMIDGKVGPPYESLVLNLVTAARFVGPTTYRFYGIKGGQIYRVTLEIT